MSLNLTPFLFLGALLVLSVLSMVVWRQAVARREDDTLHVLDGSTGAVPQQADIAHKLEAIDRWGKVLTAVTVAYCLIVGGLLVYQQWMRASNLGM